MRIKVSTVVLAGGLLALAANAATIRPQTGQDMVPTGKGYGQPSTAQHATPVLSERAIGISYHGGPVMTGTPTLYFIYYGTWSSTDKSILGALQSGLGGSAYELVNSTYYNGSGTHVSGNLSNGGSYSPGYPNGTSLSDSTIKTIVSNAITGGHLPLNSNGVYLVLTSSDVSESSGFCSSYCGWHTHATISNTDVKYGMVGNPARCPSACSAVTGSGPNGDLGADAAASIIAHEQEEAISDPDLNAWFDSSGAENADKCAWTFGTTFTTSNGSKANMTLGGRNFLIQRNWNATTGACALHL